MDKGDTMSPEGDIRIYEDLIEEEKKKYIKIPDEELPKVRDMNRKERRAWYKKNKEK